MTEKINCSNQQPAYSGITINITNPAINPPQQNNCYCTYPAENTPNTAQQGLTYSTQNAQLAQAKTDVVPQAYINKGEYLEPVDYNSENTNSDNTNKTSESTNGTNQNVYNDSRTINQYITQPSDKDNETTKKELSGYPPEYYLNNYGITPKEQNQISENQNDNNEQNIGKEIITELDEQAEKEKELEENGKQKKVVALTNEYIMSLENYLNNPNKDIRLMASKEIINRFNEDRSRYNDAALNALVNKMLQDPEKLIRVAAFSALSSELASGNDYTVQLLNKVQQNPNADPNDVLEASEILLKRASMTEVRYIRPVNGQEQKFVTKSENVTEEAKNQ